MAFTRKTRWLVATTSLAAIAVGWSGGTGDVSARTHAIGSDRIVSWTPLQPSGGDTCEPPAEDATCLWSPADRDAGGVASFQRRGGGGGAAPAGGTSLQGPPTRVIRDRYPAFSSIAVDLVRDQIVVTDENLFQVLFYDRTENNAPNQIAKPRRLVGTPWDAALMKREVSKTKIEFQCGLYLDPRNGDVYAVNNDTQDTLVIFSNEAVGNVAPDREIHTPHGTFGITVDEVNQDVYLTVQHDSAVVVYKKGAQGDEAPRRLLQGDRTRLADPHGIALDPKNDVIFVTNHGSVHSVRQEAGVSSTRAPRRAPGQLANWPLDRDFAIPGSGRTLAPSITVYARTASGDVAPIRSIEGPRTLLNWPTGIAFEADRGELYVANDTTDSILVFDASASGDVAPRRVLKGPKTGLKNPTGLALDKQHNELWVANFGGHSATVYRMSAEGDVVPLRTVRAAPAATPSLMIGNPGAVAYDTKREELLTPN